MSLSLSQDDLHKIQAYLQQFQPEPQELRAIREESERHREEHGPSCTVHPSAPGTGRMLQTFVHLLGAKRVLEIGCGLGYSAAWMALALPLGGQVETIENVREHADIARANFRRMGVADSIRIHLGDAKNEMSRLTGPYDILFDDAAHGSPPPWLPEIPRLLKPRGLAVFSNLFPVESHILGRSDWPSQVSEGSHRYVQAIFQLQEFFAFVMPITWRVLAVKTSRFQ